MERKTTIAVVLPLPPIEASLNHHPATRGGRMKQAAAVKAYRAECARRFRKALGDSQPFSGPVVLNYFWFLGRTQATEQSGKKRALRDALCRPKDKDNAIGAAKPIQDAMTDAGLLPKGDAAGRVRVGEVDLCAKATLHGGAKGVLVVITEEVAP